MHTVSELLQSIMGLLFIDMVMTCDCLTRIVRGHYGHSILPELVKILCKKGIRTTDFSSGYITDLVDDSIVRTRCD